MSKMYGKFRKKIMRQWSMPWFKTRLPNVKLNETQVVVPAVKNLSVHASTNWNYLNITVNDC